MAARSLYRTLHLSNLIRAHPIRTPTSIPRRSTRALSRTTSVAARKDTQHKDSLKPEPNEYSKSASDDEAARLDDTAFDPNQTRPEQEQASSSAESPEGNDPLDVSPANRDVSDPKGAMGEGGAASAAESGKGSSERKRQSGQGSPKKAGTGAYGGGGSGM